MMSKSLSYNDYNIISFYKRWNYTTEKPKFMDSPKDNDYFHDKEDGESTTEKEFNLE